MEIPIRDIVASAWSEAKPSAEFIHILEAALGSLEKEKTGSLFVLKQLPSLCCLSVGGQSEWANDLSTAWYLFYLAAHLMDSIEDHDPQEEWMTGQNSGVGINAVTGLYFTANAILSRLNLNPSTQKSAPLILADFYNTLLIMAGGQHIDLDQTNLTLDQYWQIAADKSGAFFSLACRSGARLGNGTQDQIDSLSRFGKELGILIQVLDDLDAVHHYLEPQAEAERIHFDHALPAVYALQVLPEEDKKILAVSLTEAPINLQKAAEALAMIETCGAGLYMLAEVHRHRAVALAALNEIGLVEETKEILVSLISKMTKQPG